MRKRRRSAARANVCDLRLRCARAGEAAAAVLQPPRHQLHQPAHGVPLRDAALHTPSVIPVNFLVQTLFYMGPKRGATYGLLARRMLWPSLATPSLSGTLSLPPSGGRGRGATLEAMGTWTTSLASDLLQNLYHAQEACVLVRSMGLFAWLLCAGGSAPITADSDSFGANAVGSAYAHLICDLNRGELLLFGHSALGIPAVFL